MPLQIWQELSGGRLGSPECQTLVQPGPLLWASGGGLVWAILLEAAGGQWLCRWVPPGCVGLLHCPCPPGPLWKPEDRAAGEEAGCQPGGGEGCVCATTSSLIQTFLKMWGSPSGEKLHFP